MPSSDQQHDFATTHWSLIDSVVAAPRSHAIHCSGRSDGDVGSAAGQSLQGRAEACVGLANHFLLGD